MDDSKNIFWRRLILEKKITNEEGLGKSRHIWLRVIEARDSIDIFL